MSVINKMLRDLDARRASAPDVSLEAGTRVLQGTAGMPGQPAARSPVRALRWLVGLLLAAATAAAWFLLEGASQSGDKPQPVTAVAITPAPEPVVNTPILAATTSVQTDGALPTPPVPAPTPPLTAPILTMPAPTVTARPPTAAPRIRSQAVAPVPSQPLASMRRSEPEKTLGAGRSQRLPTERLAASQKPAAGSSVSPTLQLQKQTSAQETLAHAQGLWAAGSREAALDLMREAVAVAERAYQSGTLAAGSPVLASLVRELARMELAEGRVNRVLELLTRLEPALAGQADLWAVRGNAAQRLARHQESVHAYLQALELRPEEPRWMLGAAVSLAALGRLEEAAVQAEKARASATVSPEILTYLRQAGVPLK